ncbi:MAG: DNA polymerase III subunit gamma/tau [Planctomycetaceae bacterium]|jgi:DNA polymerase-3 subunit gamma/tau|nr:DNA polymerase III subunit gamma/tau [Planctomycetaceae bacterium]
MSQTDSISPKEQTPDSEHYQVVARRYRPQGFTQLVGQKHVAQALSNAIQTGRIGHAYLFTGARGVGKTSSARIFAKALNCIHGPTPTPCNCCEICDSISVGEDVDVLEIDGASNRGIDEIRLLRQNASIRPSRANYKIYIIDEVHMLTREAFNALLKTLEEPPEHVKFIFCTTEPSKIPITILSRCQRYDFAGIDAVAIAQRLTEIVQKEGATADDGVFETLARRAAGSMRDAQSLLEQLLSFAPEHIALEDVHAMLGTADDQRIFRILNAINASQTASVFAELDAAAQEGVDFGIFTEQLLGIFRDLMLSACDGDQKLLMYCSPSRYDDVKQLARELGLHRILASMQVLDQTYTKMRYSTQGRILLELALVRIAHLQQLQGIAVLLDQLRNGALNIPNLSADSTSQQSAPQQSFRQTSSQTAPTSNPASDSEKLRFSDMLPQQPSRQTSTKEPRAEQQTAQKKTSDLTDVEAKQHWNEMISRLSGMTATYAALCHSVRWASPDIFIVVFPSPQAMAKSYCENDAAKIQNLLRDQIGLPIKLRFEIITIETQKKPEQHPQNSNLRKLQMMAETEEHPMVKKAAELFGASLTEVKLP